MDVQDSSAFLTTCGAGFDRQANNCVLWQEVPAGGIEMENTSSITMRLEAYLLRLSEVNRQWTDWLRRHELAAVGGNMDGLQTLQAEAEELISELSKLKENRSRLLQDAESVGIPCGSLQALAKSLPAWKKASLRNAVVAARSHLSNLRRLHVAAWVLLHQLGQYYAGSLRLLTEGTTKRTAYVTTRNADTGGGTLLDTDL